MEIEKYTANQFDSFLEIEYYFQITNGRKLTEIKHSHDFYELIYVLSGSITHCVDDKSYFIEQYNCVIISPNHTHYFKKQEKNTNIFCLSILKNKFEIMLKALGVVPKYITPFKLKNTLDVFELEKIMFKRREEKIIRLNVLLIDIIKSSLVIYEKEQNKYGLPYFLNNALIKMRTPKNLKNGVNALMDLTGYSRAQLCRISKNCCNKTPYELIQEIKMEIIKEYLLKSDMPIEKIIENAGFKSKSQFYLAVKKYYGKTPLKIRSQLKYH